MEEFALLTDDDIVARETAKTKQAEISLSQARSLAQRTKERWAKDGEKNSKYFHHTASFKYKLNNINCLKIENATCFDKKKIADETISFYDS